MVVSTTIECLYPLLVTVLSILLLIQSTTIATTIHTNSPSKSILPSSSSTFPSSPYKIVIDGGSTGSRLHIFEFIHDHQSNKTFVERKGSQKVNIPLSDFVPSSSNKTQQNNQDAAGLHLLPLFQYASQIIPKHYHSTTSVHIQATAGMRLVREEYQNELYNVIYDELVNHDEFVFDSFQRSDIHTLNGVWEGLYGVIAVNYLKGVIDVHLHYENDDDKDEEDKDNQALGALDLGGASMQIVYLPRSSTSSSSPSKSNSNQKEKLQSHEFFSTSYLSYGSDQFRERLWDTWIADHEKKKQWGNDKSVGSDKNSSTMIYNPCSFKGYQSEWKGYQMIGTGDAKQCTKEVNRLIPHHEMVHDHDSNEDGDDNYVVGGIEHPPVHGQFYAMSLFFFVMDCVRFYTNDIPLTKSWPKPTLNELSNAIDIFCSKNWDDDFINSQGEKHEFTRSAILADRCFESVYIVSLLRDGFGFETDSRDITYTFHVDGSEVEWSLGMAITSFAENNSNYVSIEAADSSSAIGNGRCNAGNHNCEEKENSTGCYSNDHDSSDDQDDEDIMTHLFTGDHLLDRSPI